MQSMIYRFTGNDEYLSPNSPVNINDGIFEYKNAAAFFQARIDYLKTYKSISNTSLTIFKEDEIENSTMSDWEEKKYAVMYEVQRMKFDQHKELQEKLIKTKNAYLLYGNIIHDNEFGFCMCSTCRHILKKNRLGEILMKLREEYKNKKNILKLTSLRNN